MPRQDKDWSFLGIQVAGSVITDEKLLLPIPPQHCVPVFLVFEGNRKNLTASGYSVLEYWGILGFNRWGGVVVKILPAIGFNVG
jgi:hypothetical protein